MKKITVLFSLLLVVAVFLRCMDSKNITAPQPANYVGTATCQSCHQQAFKDYTSSDHFHAMDTASAASVKADFNNSRFIYHGDTSFFYKKNGQFFVRTIDSAGHQRQFKISYTFGWQPLQQYLVKFSDGRIQSLPFCWDVRPKEKGGQRWFHLYSKENIQPGDELFWMGINHNWNYMCADCHTTNYKTNFNITDNTFSSHWNESKVSCESCHGPASKHIAWAGNKAAPDSLKGFALSLSPHQMNWVLDENKGTMIPKNPVLQTTQIETCARCHARATRLTENYQHGKSFLQTHLPSMLDTSVYYPDGQIKDEDYEYGSFLQSKMYVAGVTCTNCHNPHSMQLKATGNQVCASCHTPAKYNMPDHTHHLANSAGAKCVSCHMPVTTYMGVDNRLDHSIRIPRPDLSAQTRSPNACNKCHSNKPVEWAAASFKKWYGYKIKPGFSQGQHMMALLKTNVGSKAAFTEILMSQNYPAIVKATAMQQYSQYAATDLGMIKKYLQQKDPMLRLAALRSLSYYPPETVMPLAAPLLSDEVATVRLEAVNVLLPFYNQLDVGLRNNFSSAMNEYLAIQRNMGHRPEGFLNQASVMMATGQTNEALQLYLKGIERFPKFIPMYVNLADYYRDQQQEAQSKLIIDNALAVAPKNPQLHYVLGLWHVRQKNQSAGMAELKKSVMLDSKNPTFNYAYSIGLFSEGRKDAAIKLLENFLQKNGNNNQVITGLISICQDMGDTAKAAKYLHLRKEVYGY